jgi:hypothetical protein
VTTAEGAVAAADEARFPIERTLEAAWLAGDRAAADVPRLVAWLDDPAEPVRWWAAQGLAMLAKRGPPSAALGERIAAALRPRLADASGAVQVAAAEGLIGLGESAGALAALSRQIEGPNPWFALAAGNVVDRIGAAAAPLEPILARFVARPEQRMEDKRPAAVRYPGDVIAHALAVIRGETEALVYPAATAPTAVGHTCGARARGR